MKQYEAIKAKYPDALLLFRVGDFYETFGTDAITASKILDIVLTKRANGSASHIELAGFPHHSLDTYLPKLVRAGQRVAICDQLEDPKLTKTIVKRGVTELVTPGMTLNDQILHSKSNNFLASVYIEKDIYGVSFADISTGEFLAAQGSQDYVDKLLQSFAPSEVIFPKKDKKTIQHWLGNRFYQFAVDDWTYQFDYAQEQLTQHLGTKTLKGFGVDDMPEGIIAAGAILKYLRDSQHDKLGHITAISRIVEHDHVWMDRFTIRNLEIFRSNAPDGKSLIDVIDHTLSPMGARTLKRWVALPLKNAKQIEQRYDVVDFFKSKSSVSDQIGEQLSQIYDLERLVAKIASARISPKEILVLGQSLMGIARIKKTLEKHDQPALLHYCSLLDVLPQLQDLITKNINENAPVAVQKGGVFKTGINPELDELRSLRYSGKDYLEKLQQRESENSGITSLKLGFNNVFGYFLEVRNTHKDKVPETWIRKQTLVGAERYITEELKEYESKILGAEEKILQLETELFVAFVLKLTAYISVLQQNANVVGQLDCLLCFGNLARQYKYNRPTLREDASIQIKGGRHPVIEQQLNPDENYVANDLALNKDDTQIIMITGPNMSGKSAILRQTALICLLAQIGSFVPAKEAQLGLLDKIFVRVGASDNISQGESTFMVEMNETASILNNLSNASLVLLDEIGRGTSTYDGISIAWAISEYLHNHTTKPLTLFATHYHELNQMSEAFERIKNYNVSVKEINNSIIFMRKLVPGGSAHSFGIHVAQMAGMPQFVINKANKMLAVLESQRDKEPKTKLEDSQDMQLSFFKLNDPLLEEIKQDLNGIDINTLTPVEALMVLNEWKKKLGIG